MDILSVVRMTALVLFFLPQTMALMLGRTWELKDEVASVVEQAMPVEVSFAEESEGSPYTEMAVTWAVYELATAQDENEEDETQLANASLGWVEASLESSQEQLDYLTEKQYHIIRSTKKLVWVLGSYHKTGTELAMGFISRISEKRMMRNNKAMLRSQPMIFDPEYPMGNYYFNPEAAIIQALPRYRFVHFIRDPVSLVVSAYRYHSQGTEPWLHIPVLKLKKDNGYGMKDMFGSLKELRNYVARRHKRHALARFNKAVKQGASLYHYYQHANEKEAIFIELFRSWHEIQLIMSNYIATRQDPYTVQMRMESVQKDFHSSMKCLVKFLHGSMPSMPSMQEAMGKLEDLDVAKHPETTKSVHITSGKYDNSKLLKLLETVKPLMEAQKVLQLPAQNSC